MELNYPEYLFDLNAEAAVMGALILDRSKCYDVQDVLNDGLCFYRTEHRVFYKFLLELNRRKDTGWDLIVFRDELRRQNLMETVGGWDWVIKILESVPHAESCAYYAQIVYEKYLRRKLYDFGETVKAASLDGEKIELVIGNIQNDLRELTVGEMKSASMILLESALADLPFQSKEDFITTGIEAFDSKIMGFGKGHFVIVAGRPSMGKTTFLLSLLKRLLVNQRSGVFFSMEMTRTDLMQKLVYSETANVPMSFCYRYFLNDNQKMQLEYARQKMKRLNLVLDDGRYLTPQKLRNHIHILKQSRGIEIVFIDYLQLLKPDRRFNSRYEEISFLSSELKSIAMEYEIPLIVACQLNRAVESRPDKIPRMSDLRDSGNIEQDADTILLLHRPPYYINATVKQTEQIDETEAEIHIAKTRRGSTGKIYAKFYGEYSRYEITE